MELIIKRNTLDINPINAVELAYMEEVLGVQKTGDTCVCERIDGIFIGGEGRIEIRKTEKE